MTTISQWNCVLQNLGEWQGSFTQISPGGKIIKDTPSLISLEGVDGNRSIHLNLKRFYSDTNQPHELAIDFSAAGDGALFFPSGAFSEGSTYFSAGLKFGAEFSFIHQDRRLRLVQIYGLDNRPSQFTLIREWRVGTDTPERSPLTPLDWTGHWQGEALTLYPGVSTVTREVATTATSIKALVESEPGQDSAIASSQQIEYGFELEGITYQITFLPDGAIAIFPQQICAGFAFFMETGWLIQPSLRQRLIRRYSAQGQWISLSWIAEAKVSDHSL
jgi:hypothetical protein